MREEICGITASLTRRVSSARRTELTAEPARPPKQKDFLAPSAQEFWFEGNLFAESDTDRLICIDGRQVGHITHNGEIWVESIEMGERTER